MPLHASCLEAPRFESACGGVVLSKPEVGQATEHSIAEWSHLCPSPHRAKRPRSEFLQPTERGNPQLIAPVALGAAI
jgi:hypothetical protein